MRAVVGGEIFAILVQPTGHAIRHFGAQIARRQRFDAVRLPQRQRGAIRPNHGAKVEVVHPYRDFQSFIGDCSKLFLLG